MASHQNHGADDIGSYFMGGAALQALYLGTILLWPVSGTIPGDGGSGGGGSGGTPGTAFATLDFVTDLYTVNDTHYTLQDLFYWPGTGPIPGSGLNQWGDWEIFGALQPLLFNGATVVAEVTEDLDAGSLSDFNQEWFNNNSTFGTDYLTSLNQILDYNRYNDPAAKYDDPADNASAVKVAWTVDPGNKLVFSRNGRAIHTLTGLVFESLLQRISFSFHPSSPKAFLRRVTFYPRQADDVLPVLSSLAPASPPEWRPAQGMLYADFGNNYYWHNGAVTTQAALFNPVPVAHTTSGGTNITGTEYAMLSPADSLVTTPHTIILEYDLLVSDNIFLAQWYQPNPANSAQSLYWWDNQADLYSDVDVNFDMSSGALPAGHTGKIAISVSATETLVSGNGGVAAVSALPGYPSIANFGMMTWPGVAVLKRFAIIGGATPAAHLPELSIP